MLRSNSTKPSHENSGHLCRPTIVLSSIEPVSTRPLPRRSSGIWARPNCRSTRAFIVVVSIVLPGCPFSTGVIAIFPLVILRIPVSASTSSDCPLPSTPAIPRISPARTSKLTPCRTSKPRSESVCRSSTCNTTGPGWAGVLLTRSSTSRPTIIRAISA